MFFDWILFLIIWDLIWKNKNGLYEQVYIVEQALEAHVQNTQTLPNCMYIVHIDIYEGSEGRNGGLALHSM